MSAQNYCLGYYDEYLKETSKIIREQDQSTGMSDIVREIEIHSSEMEEEERNNVTARDI